MADEGSRLEETVRRTFQANVQLYEAIGQASLAYVKALGAIWSGMALPLNLGSLSPAFSPAPAPAAPRAPAPPAPAPSPALVLAGEAGQEARGVFMVANQLGRRVSAPVVTSPFTDPAGREVHPAFRIEPELVTLDAGEQILVQVVVSVGEDLEPGLDYRAAVSVPGLSDSRVALVLRRRAPAPPPPSPPAKAAAPPKPRRKKG